MTILTHFNGTEKLDQDEDILIKIKQNFIKYIYHIQHRNIYYLNLK